MDTVENTDLFTGLSEAHNEVGADTETPTNHQSEMDEIYDRANRLRTVVERQNIVADKKSMRCDAIMALKRKLDISDEINDLENKQPNLYAYLRELQSLTVNGWCITCTRPKLFRGRPEPTADKPMINAHGDKLAQKHKITSEMLDTLSDKLKEYHAFALNENNAIWCDVCDSADKPVIDHEAIAAARHAEAAAKVKQMEDLHLFDTYKSSNGVPRPMSGTVQSASARMVSQSDDDSDNGSDNGDLTAALNDKLRGFGTSDCSSMVCTKETRFGNYDYQQLACRLENLRSETVDILRAIARLSALAQRPSMLPSGGVDAASLEKMAFSPAQPDEPSNDELVSAAFLSAKDRKDGWELYDDNTRTGLDYLTGPREQCPDREMDALLAAKLSGMGENAISSSDFL